MKKFFLLLAVLVLSSPVRALDLDAPIPFDPQVRTGVLDNGLRWYVRENAEPKQRAALRLVVNAGSVLEDDDQRGLAHFLEHMAFNGTQNFEKQALVDYLESIGMEFGPEINAYTSFDETVYMLMVPTDDAEILSTAFTVLADWSRHISLDPEEVVKERGVVLEEWRLGRGARQRVRDEQIPLTYHGSNYAERLPIGRPEIIESATAESLRRFYDRWYRPELMAVVAVGDFDAATIESLITENFEGAWGRGPAPERPVHEIPDHDETLVKVSTDPELTTNSVRVLVKKPRAPMQSLADYRRSIVEGLYDGMFGNRLREIVEKPNPPFITAGMGGSSLGRTRDAVYLYAMAEDGAIPRALEGVLIEARRVAEHGFTATELERQKKRVLRSVRRQYQERETTPSSSHAGRYTRHFLDESPVVDAAWRWEFYQEVLPTITLDEVNALVEERDVLVEKNRVVVASAPETSGVEVPSPEQLLAAFEAVVDVTVEPYEDEVTDDPLLAELPTPGKVVATEFIDELDLTIWTLDNGVRVFVKPTDFEKDEFTLSAFSPGGRSLGTFELDRSLDMADMMAEIGGLGDFDSIALKKKLAGKRVRMSSYIGAFEEGLRGGGSPEDLELALQLFWLTVREPRRDADAFEAIRQRYLPFIRNRALDPSQIYSDTLNVTLTNGHPWSTPIDEQQLQDLDLDRGLAFYRERFAAFDDGVVVIVGNVDLQTLRPLVERYIGSLPGNQRQEQWRDPGITMPEGPLHKVVRAGVDAKARTTLVMHGDFEWNRENRFVLGALSKALGIRLREVIREDLSGTYGVSVNFSSSRIPKPEWTGRISFGADPDRLDELVEQAIGVLEDVRSHGFEGEIVEKVREQFEREHETNLRENSYWMSVIAFRARHGIDQREELETEALIDSLDARMLADAAARYLPTETILRFDHLPE